SGDGPSWAVYIESGAIELSNNLIDGWHGNPTSVGLHLAGGGGLVSQNEINGGTGSSGGDPGRTCPSALGGSSTGLVSNSVGYRVIDNIILGGASSAPTPCGTNGVSASVGVRVDAQPFEFTGNTVTGGGSLVADICASGSRSVGVEVRADFTNRFGFIEGGGACGGIADTSTAVEIVNPAAGEPAAPVVAFGGDNLLILGGFASNATGVRAEASTTIDLTNVTFFDDSGDVGSVAVDARGGVASLRNSVFSGWGTGYRALDAGSLPVELRNNAFSVTAVLSEASTTFPTVESLELALMAAAGKTEGLISFVDTDGPDDDPPTYEDNLYTHAPTTACDV
ncbi:MAG: hypothetical protein AAF658_22705, partial [Myxococcota bacterium]